MTVSDLIKQLKDLDPELEVVVDGAGTEYLSGLTNVAQADGYCWDEQAGNYHAYPSRIVVISITQEATHQSVPPRIVT